MDGNGTVASGVGAVSGRISALGVLKVRATRSAG